MPPTASTQSRTSASIAVLTALLALSACSIQEIPGGESESTGVEITETGESDDGPGDTGPDDLDLGGGGSGEGDSGTESECGNGIVEAGESCDDGNLESGDGCASACSLEGLIIPCGSKIFACGDGVDNDGDGEVDSDDPECISPCDDDEGSFQTDIPGAHEDCKSDCFFDANSGSGNEGCEWNLKCDPHSPGAEIGCEYDPNFAMCELEMPPDCLDACVPLVPNGCDCFGCCEIAGEHYYLDSSDGCSLDNLEACQTCTFHEGCNNPCEPEHCELCFGQDPSELPEDCGPIECPDGVATCESSVDCEAGWFCQTGCCAPVVG